MMMTKMVMVTVINYLKYIFLFKCLASRLQANYEVPRTYIQKEEHNNDNNNKVIAATDSSRTTYVPTFYQS